MRAYSSQLILQAPKQVAEPAPSITGTDTIIVATNEADNKLKETRANAHKPKITTA